MDYDCQRSTKFDAIKCESRSTMFPHLKIKFNFSFQTEQSNYILNQDSVQFLESLPPSNFTIAADVTAQKSLSHADVRENLEKAIGGRLLGDERRCVIKRAWREVREILPGRSLPFYTILYLNFKIRLTHSHVYGVEGDSSCDSSPAMMEKCDDGGFCAKAEAEERCCRVRSSTTWFR